MRQPLVAILVLGTSLAAWTSPSWGNGATLRDSRFGQRTLVDGLDRPTAVAFGPRRHLFVAEQGGRVFVARPGRRPRLLLDISDHVNSANERGLLGIALDRRFRRNGRLYLLYTTDSGVPGPDAEGPQRARLTRVVVHRPLEPRRLGRDPHERVLLGRLHGTGPCPQAANATDCIPSDATSHTIGTVRVDPRDGTLWVSEGDGAPEQFANALAFRANDPVSLAGKVLHVGTDGRGLPGHPFCPGDGDLAHVCTKLYASGLRNPFRFGLSPRGEPLYAGAVGWYRFEALDAIRPGRDYGWPCYEGAAGGAVQREPDYAPSRACQARYSNGPSPPRPLVSYPHPVYQAIVGGPRIEGHSFPRRYRGRVFFGDYGRGRLWSLPMRDAFHTHGRQIPFADGWTGVDIQEARRGVVYVDIASGSVEEIVYAPDHRPPSARPSVDPGDGRVPFIASFHAHAREAHGRRVFCYWSFGDGGTASHCNARHRYTTPGHWPAGLRVTDGFKAVNRRVRVVAEG